MTAYFTASIFAKKYHLGNYRRIVDFLESRGIKVISEHILKGSEAKIRLETKQQRIAFIRQLENWINSCNFMVVEATFPSISVGYEISLALRRGKAVLILYSEGDPPSLLGSDTDDRVVCEKYTPDALPELLEGFIRYVEGAADSRFTFFITPQIAGHLEHMSQKHRIPKSVYLRQLLEKDISNRRTS